MIERFAKFFSIILDNNEKLIDPLRKAVLRLSISLVLQRKKWDKLFLKRSLIKEHVGDDRVGYLAIFFLKWIENFNSKFSEIYMVAKSTLKISEKRVQEKLDNGVLRKGTYLNKVLHKDSPNSHNDVPSPPETGNEVLTPRNKKIIKIEVSTKQVNQPNQGDSSPENIDSSTTKPESPDKSKNHILTCS